MPLAAAAGIALENGRLRAELRARLQELQGSRVRVLEAGRQERQRLERDLHDGAQQRLVALSLELGLHRAERDGRSGAQETAGTSEDRGVGIARGAPRRGAGIYPAVLLESRPGRCTGVAGGSGSCPRPVDGRSRRPAAPSRRRWRLTTWSARR